MSFLSGLKQVGKVAFGIATNPASGAIISAFNPSIGSIWGRVASSIVSIEEAHSQAGKEKSGAEKLALAINDFNESLAITREILKSHGKDLVYDNRALEDAINAQVAAFNAAKKLKDSIKIQEPSSS